MTATNTSDGVLPGSTPEERVLVLAPTGRDGPLTCELFNERAGIKCEVCASLNDLCGKLDGAGALVIAEEALEPRNADLLLRSLAAQPPWSDISLIILTGRIDDTGRTGLRTVALLRMRASVTLLERPIRVVTLISAVQAALRARRRQHEVRDLLADRDAALRHRDDFLAMLGHELRNPLGTIRNAMAVLNAAVPGDGLVREQREIIARQAEHLACLVDDLLDVSRLTRGKITLRRRPVDLGEIAAATARTVDTAVQAQTLRLTVSTSPEPVTVNGDPTRLEQIIINLLTNAIKYTPPGGQIFLSVSAEGKDAVLRVRDTGIGIPADLLRRVFELFSQAERSLDRSQGGLGIGLTLVESLVKMHGGTVTAESAGDGKGTEFTVRFPAVSRPNIAVATPPSPPPMTTGGQHVLVIEDNADSRRALQRLLQVWGHRVDTACDGPQGIALALEAKPAVALVDIGLPGLDGYEVARQIRASLGNSVRLIALTGYGQPDDRDRARAAGFDLHLTKPVDPKRLAAALGEQ